MAKILSFPKKDGDPPRWQAVVRHRRAVHAVHIRTLRFEEISELHDLIENGPHWGTIIDCKITLLRDAGSTLTIEEAEKL